MLSLARAGMGMWGHRAWQGRDSPGPFLLPRVAPQGWEQGRGQSGGSRGERHLHTRERWDLGVNLSPLQSPGYRQAGGTLGGSSWLCFPHPSQPQPEARRDSLGRCCPTRPRACDHHLPTWEEPWAHQQCTGPPRRAVTVPESSHHLAVGDRRAGTRYATSTPVPVPPPPGISAPAPPPFPLPHRGTRPSPRGEGILGAVVPKFPPGPGPLPRPQVSFLLPSRGRGAAAGGGGWRSEILAGGCGQVVEWEGGRGGWQAPYPP